MNLTIYTLTYIMVSVPQVDRDGTPRRHRQQKRKKEGSREMVFEEELVEDFLGSF